MPEIEKPDPERPEGCDCEACRRMDQKNAHDAGLCDLDCPFCPSMPADLADIRRALTNGKSTCHMCEEVIARDDLTLCFNTTHGMELLRVVCLACRKDKPYWQAWSHKVPI